MELVPPDFISRPLYLSRITPYMRTPLIKVLTGPRQVGKSYMMFQIMDQILQEDDNPNIIYINLESMAHRALQDEESLYSYIMQQLKENRRNYIFIDEVQQVENGWKALLSLRLNAKNDIYVTGSNADLFSGDIANALGARYIKIQINSLSFNEFLVFHNLPNTVESLEKYERFGGLPYLKYLNLDRPQEVENYILNAYNATLYRDVIARNHLKNSNFISQLADYLADNVGSLFSVKSISDHMKNLQSNVSQTLISDYLNALVNAFIVLEVKRYNIVGKRLFERIGKYYFENLGVRNSLVGYRKDDRGKRMENLVFNHLRCCEFTVMVGEVAGYEIDFICKRGAETLD
ncbi:MAG: ATP-binding protein, partial [Bacteroidia bacterium]|nr:ATP-binding protein [Bacteroidia bacterium]